MPIGKNSINRVSLATGGAKAEPEKTEEVKTEVVIEEKAAKPAPKTKKAESAKKAPAKKAPAKKAPAKKKTDTVKEVVTELRADLIDPPKKPAVKKTAKAEDKKAYVNIGDEMPVYLL